MEISKENMHLMSGLKGLTMQSCLPPAGGILDLVRAG